MKQVVLLFQFLIVDLELCVLLFLMQSRYLADYVVEKIFVRDCLGLFETYLLENLHNSDHVFGDLLEWNCHHFYQDQDEMLQFA